MTTAELHPWLGTPEAFTAARKAVQIPLALMGGRAMLIGVDEMESEALLILAECALPLRETQEVVCAGCQGSLEAVRAGAKFCSKKCRTNHSVAILRNKAETLPPRSGGHIGSMWKWPEDERSKYAIRQVGYLLNNWLRTRGYAAEVSASEFLSNTSLPIEEPEVAPLDILSAWLEDHGIRTTGDETVEELTETVLHLRGSYVAPRGVELAAAA